MTAAAKERPILFAAPMVQALLAGRKTMTRRLVQGGAPPRQGHNPADIQYRPPGQPWYGDYVWSMRRRDGVWEDFTEEQFLARCPYGRPGDKLWVKETWRPEVIHRCVESCECSDVRVHYAAGGEAREVAEDTISDYEDLPGKKAWRLPQAALRSKNVSPLFMPRWASRLTLTLTDVSAQRLRDITEDDAMREGVTPLDGLAAEQTIAGDDPLRRTQGSAPHTLAFAVLWDHLHGDRAPWFKNPVVWRLGFTVEAESP